MDKEGAIRGGKSVRMLVIISSPLCEEEKKTEYGKTVIKVQALSALNEDKERELLLDALSKARIPVEVTFLPEATVREIGLELEGGYDIVHFSGHGGKDGRLRLEDGNGQAYPIEPSAFRNLFLNKKPKILFLSACHSESTAREFLNLNIPCVIYLSGEIHDKAATLFCQHFYHAAARGRTLIEAFDSAVRVVAADQEVGDEHVPTDKGTVYSKRFSYFIPSGFRNKAVFEGLGEGTCEDKSSSPPLTNVPEKDKDFVGREEDICNITKALSARKVVNIVAEPGMGKSELAKAVAKWSLKRCKYPGGIFWAGAGDEPERRKLNDLDSLLNIILNDYCDKDAQQIKEDKKRRAILEILKKGILLVLDNYESVKDDEELWGFIKDLPREARCLITSRESLDPAQVANIELGRLSMDESLGLFTIIIQKVAHGISKIRPEEDCKKGGLIEQIVDLLHGWPLAIEVTAGQIRDSSVKEILEDLRKNPGEVLDSVDPRTGKPMGIWTRLKSSYMRLSEEDKKIFRRISVFVSPVERKDVEAVLDSTRHQIGGLVDRRLIRHDNGRYFMHPIIKEFASDMMREASDDSRLLHLKAFENFKDSDAITASDHLYELGQQDDELMKKFLDYTSPFLNTLKERGFWSTVIIKAKQCLKGSRLLSNRNSESFALSLIGDTLYLKGSMDEALAYLQKALGLHRELGDKQSEATNLGNIGLIYGSLGKMNEAFAHYEEALNIFREIGDRQGEANQLGNIGFVHNNCGRMNEALAYYEEALNIFREIGDRNSEALQLGHIGFIYKSRDRMKALDYLQKALSINQELGNKQGEATDLGDIGIIYRSLGKMNEAFAHLQESYMISRALGYRRGVAASLSNIAGIYAYCGMLDEALAHYEEALKMFREIGYRQGEADQLINIGSIYSHIDRIGDALAYSEEALKIYREISAAHLVQQAEKLIELIKKKKVV